MVRIKSINPAGFAFYREFCERGIKSWHSLPPIKKKDSLSSSDVILKDIFRINPATGLPEGDLAVFLSENTSPDVRDYVQRNLLNENPNIVADSSGLHGLDDDTIIELTRGANETSVSYSTRVFEYLKGVRKSELAKQKKQE